jgi:hypothetical protein
LNFLAIPSKPFALVFDFSALLGDNLPCLQINVISSVVSNKCSGADLDDRLTFDINIEEICKKICSGIGALRRIKPFVPQSSLVTLYKSLIYPYFDYCSPHVGYMR